MSPVRKSLVISNAPAVWNLFPGCKRLRGLPLEVLREARDRVHQGWQLLGHPPRGQHPPDAESLPIGAPGF
jgi:hypothetical protein